MFKKPLFWIIVVIIAVVLWFVFAGRGRQAPNTAAVMPSTTTQANSNYANANETSGTNNTASHSNSTTNRTVDKFPVNS